MTIEIISVTANGETANAVRFRNSLLASEPQLNHPDIRIYILCNLHLPQRELDLVMLYYDPRMNGEQLFTSEGLPIHSFVLVVEVKQHSPDLIRFEGPKVEVRYNQDWSDATYQADQQTYALKQYQNNPYMGARRREPTYVQRAIWLARAPRSAFQIEPGQSSVPVHFADLQWKLLVDGLAPNTSHRAIRTLASSGTASRHHDIETLLEVLTHKVTPTQLDLRRVNALTQTRFDVEKTAYIQNLGSGLLLLRGRGGTGKTFALVQIAIHLARQGMRTVLLTYNHGLIADISRALRFIAEQDEGIAPMPVIMTRYSFYQKMFVQAFGLKAEKSLRANTPLSDREEKRLSILMAKRELPKSDFDYALVDEGQDWSDPQRDYLYRIFNSNRVIVADGVNQFVGQERCSWDLSDIPINRRHSLRSSRRTKAATCQTVAEIAQDVGLTDWDLEPDANTHGGRFTVFIEPNPVRAVDRGLAIIALDQRQYEQLRPVDNLVCLPSSKMANGINYGVLFDRATEKDDQDSWRGFEDADRRIYPVRESQLRAVQYHSCRGMEGWTTLCLGLDSFYDFQTKNPLIDPALREVALRQQHGLLYSRNLLDASIAEEAKLFANNWLMIPLTRSIDHLVLHLQDERSALAHILMRVSARSPGSIEWLR